MKKPPKHKTNSKRPVPVAVPARSHIRVRLGRMAKAITHLLASDPRVSRRGTPTGLSAREVVGGLVPKDRQLIGLLFAPFAVLTIGLAMSLALKQRLSLKELIAQRPPVYLRNSGAALTALFSAAPAAVPVASTATAHLASVGTAKFTPAAVAANRAARMPEPAAPRPGDIELRSAALEVAGPSASPRAMSATLGELASLRITAVDSLGFVSSSGPPGILSAAPLAQASMMQDLAMSLFTAEIAAVETDLAPSAVRPSRCALDDAAQSGTLLRQDAVLLTSTSFGTALAQAAQSQTAELVIYNDSYRQISYPLGDVPALFGVCTDVVIRAYRTLGVDLQALVHQARGRRSDPSIDHRRVETLRRFFAVYGAKLPASDFADDYWPGDIVTYSRPQNRHGQSHIAIVADRIGPSGRPMIVHNRGWGPQLEDALFVDEITGHYRYAPAAAQLAGSAGTEDFGSERTMARGIIRLKRAAISAKRLSVNVPVHKVSLEISP